jgi:hypothetical protein
MSFKSTLKWLGMRQNSRPELLVFRVDSSEVDGSSLTKDGLSEGSNHATIQKTATGRYTISLNRACRRIPVVLGAVAVGENFVRLTAEPTAAGVITVAVEADDGTDTDADFHISVLTFYSETER